MVRNNGNVTSMLCVWLQVHVRRAENLTLPKNKDGKEQYLNPQIMVSVGPSCGASSFPASHLAFLLTIRRAQKVLQGPYFRHADCLAVEQEGCLPADY